MSTRHRAQLLITAFLIAAVPALGAEAPPLPTRTLILFVADWCAPCHAEVARVPAIAAAAKPWRVRVTSGDANPSHRLLQHVAVDQRWTPDAHTAALLRDELLSRTAGLPFAVALDGNGRVCAESAHALDAERTAMLLARCKDWR